MVNDERVSLPSLNPSPNFYGACAVCAAVGAFPLPAPSGLCWELELSTENCKLLSQISNDRMPSLSNLSEPRAGTQAGQLQAGLA